MRLGNNNVGKKREGKCVSDYLSPRQHGSPLFVFVWCTWGFNISKGHLQYVLMMLVFKLTVLKDHTGQLCLTSSIQLRVPSMFII